MPPANGLTASRDDRPQEFPLALEQCACGNFQIGHCVDPKILYSDYAYYTPRSPSLTAHYENLIGWMERNVFVKQESNVLEIGSNIGRFLEVLKPRVHSVLGVDPAQAIAKEATDNGIATIPLFFGPETGSELYDMRGGFDLIGARHCMAHNPSPYPMLEGAYSALATGGTLVIENAYAIKMLENSEWDQIYHEHMFHFTLLAMNEMLTNRGFAICGVMQADLHGGSIVVAAQKFGRAKAFDLKPELDRERGALAWGLVDGFTESVARSRKDVCAAIREFIDGGKLVYAYGATAKGATLMNACGLTYKDIPICVDSTPAKQGRFVPKVGCEIVSEEWAFANPPDAFLLTAWNYRDEIIAKVRARIPEARFIVPIPTVEIV